MNTKRNLVVIAGLAALVIATYFGFGAANQQNTAQADGDKTGLSTVKLESDEAKLGYMFGTQVASNIMAEGVDKNIDVEAFLAAQRDVLNGNEPRMTGEEMQATQQKYILSREQEAADLAEANKAKGEAYLAENKGKEGVVITDSGLQYQVLREGQGKQPTKEGNVKVHYSGTLVDGTTFDSSYERSQPATFPVGGLIPGFTEGLLLMKEGAKFRLVIPSDIAYGLRASGPIGPNETLIFEVELLEVL